MLSWLEGDCIDLHLAPAATRRDSGRALARLGRALRGCSADGAPQDLPWDLSNTAALRPMLDVLAEPPLRDLAAARLEHFEQVLQPALAALPRQLIHTDLNPDNVLFSPVPQQRVSGIIDFGDMVEGPLVCDLAVAATYHLTVDGDSLLDLLPVIEGYEESAALPDAQRMLLLPLVECRLLATLLIQGSRSRGEPPFTTASLRPSALEAAQRLQWLDSQPQSWNPERLLQLLA
jgi:Ser/Thr protein kinase RdoA (MazF antagonist)